MVRLTADCPLADPSVIDGLVAFFESGGFDYASNTLERTWPRGLDAEVMTLDTLRTAWREARRAEDLEHVTPFICGRPDRFKLGAFTGEVSGAMLQGVCSHVIVGHSERRHGFGETDGFVNAKVLAVLGLGNRHGCHDLFAATIGPQVAEVVQLEWPRLHAFDHHVEVADHHVRTVGDRVPILLVGLALVEFFHVGKRTSPYDCYFVAEASVDHICSFAVEVWTVNATVVGYIIIAHPKWSPCH